MQTPSSDRIDRILTSLDQVPRVPAPPYFYTRLRARLDRTDRTASGKPMEHGILWLRPIPVVTLLLLLLLLNSWLINTPVADPVTAVKVSATDGDDDWHVLAFEERTAEHAVTEYELTPDLYQK